MPITQEMANRYPPQQPHTQPQVEVHLGNGVPSMFPRPRAGMWPQLPPQQIAVEQSEKQREYLKQQQKLRLMTTTSTAKFTNILEELIVSKLPPDKVVSQKTNILSHHHENVRACGGSIQRVAGNIANHHATQAVSADALIENLLEKKETFKPRNSHHGLVPAPGNQRMLGNAGIPVHASGLASSHLGASVIRPTVSYPVSSTAAVSSGPSSGTSMMGSYSTSVLPPEAHGSFCHNPMTAANKGYATGPPMNQQPHVNFPAQAQFSFNIPAWLMPSSQLLPQFYRQVWKLVEKDKGLVDTARIFPLLLTSGLPTDVLGFIWGLANHKVAGQLTEEELYIVLALVALAQSGCVFNDLSVLSLIPQPPLPVLKLAHLESVTSAPSKDTEVAATSNPVKMKREELNFHLVPSSTPSSGGDDEFTDFQSAVSAAIETSSVNIKEQGTEGKVSDAQSNTVAMVAADASMVQKCPSVMVVNSSSHGRGIGSRLANHSLGTPKQKKTKHHHHHHHHHHNHHHNHSQSPVTASLDEEFSEFQQAKDTVASIGSPGDGTADEVFPKCALKTPQGKMYLLKESAIRSETQVGSKKQSTGAVKDGGLGGLVSLEGAQPDFQPIMEVKSTGLSSDKSESAGSQQDQTVVSEGLCAESVPESKTSVSGTREGVNLMSIEEDRYSALRNLSLVGHDTSSHKPQVFLSTEQSSASDDFGDFLSAELVEGVDDSFAVIAAREQAPSTNIASSVDMWKTDSPQTAEFQIDDWGEYEGATLPATGSNLHQPLYLAGENKLDDSANSIKKETDISTVFRDLKLDNGSRNVWDIKDSTVMLDRGKEEASDFLSLSKPSTDLNSESSWNFKLKGNCTSHSDTTSNAEIAEHDANFQGFLGKLHDDDDDDDGDKNYSTKVDMFFSSPDDQWQGESSDKFGIDGGDDDFGEFVGPNTWLEDKKCNALTKDILFDGQLGQGLKDVLYGDSQSVSSLELPPLSLSRHGSVPSLDLKVFPSTTEKNSGNGDNQPWDMSPQGIDRQLSEWQRCLQSCLTLLQSAVGTFNSVSSREVLDEVTGSVEGKAYLHNLLEVAGVSHRVECSYKQLGNNGEYKQLDPLLADIDGAWSSLESYYLKAEIPVDLELDLVVDCENGNSFVCDPTMCCGVCLLDVISGTKTDRGRNTSHLEYGGHVYHSVCANLWVNCVDSSLPALAGGHSSFL